MFSFRAVVICSLFFLLAGAAGADQSERSVTASRQFTILHPDLAARGAFASFVEETKDQLLGLLNIRDDWRIPIAVYTHEPSLTRPREPFSMRLFYLPQGPQIQMNVVFGPEFSVETFREEVIRALYLELAYREVDAQRAPDTYFMPPSWLVTGTAAHLLARQNQGYGAPLYAALTASGRATRLADFVASPSTNRNPITAEVDRAYAMALVRALLELPDGRRGMVRFIRELSAGGDRWEMLGAAFPALAGTDEEVERWWALSLARLSTMDRNQPMSAEETDARLADLLLLRVPVAPGGDEEAGEAVFELRDHRAFLHRRTRAHVLAPMQESLAGLLPLANPLLQPVISEYMGVIQQLARGRAKGVEEKLEDLASLRRDILERMEEIEDYLNWYEATQTPQLSNLFDGYFQTAVELREKPAPRTDPLADYVTSIEREVQ